MGERRIQKQETEEEKLKTGGNRALMKSEKYLDGALRDNEAETPFQRIVQREKRAKNREKTPRQRLGEGRGQGHAADPRYASAPAGPGLGVQGGGLGTHGVLQCA